MQEQALRAAVRSRLQAFAVALDDPARPDHAPDGVAEAVAWAGGLGPALRAAAGAELSEGLRSGSPAEVALAARLGAAVPLEPDAVGRAWERSDLTAPCREELGFRVRDLVRGGALRWSPGWRAGLLAPGGHAALGAALVGDRAWALQVVGAVVGPALSTAMLRLMAATSGLSPAEEAREWAALARDGVGLSDDARARCAAMGPWLEAQAALAGGDAGGGRA